MRLNGVSNRSDQPFGQADQSLPRTYMYRSFHDLIKFLPVLRLFRRGMSCRMVLQARPGHRLMFRFSSLDIKFTRYSIFGKTNSRCVDYVEIHDGSSESSPFIDGRY